MGCKGVSLLTYRRVLACQCGCSPLFRRCRRESQNGFQVRHEGFLTTKQGSHTKSLAHKLHLGVPANYRPHKMPGSLGKFRGEDSFIRYWLFYPFHLRLTWQWFLGEK